jgi:excisionase family DNA binding protein
MSEKKYLTVEQYADLLGVSRLTVRDWVTARRIHFTPVGGRLTRFSEEDIEANRAEWHKSPIGAPTGVTNIRSRRRRAAA